MLVAAELVVASWVDCSAYIAVVVAEVALLAELDLRSVGIVVVALAG